MEQHPDRAAAAGRRPESLEAMFEELTLSAHLSELEAENQHAELLCPLSAPAPRRSGSPLLAGEVSAADPTAASCFSESLTLPARAGTR